MGVFFFFFEMCVRDGVDGVFFLEVEFQGKMGCFVIDIVDVFDFCSRMRIFCVFLNILWMFVCGVWDGGIM